MNTASEDVGEKLMKKMIKAVVGMLALVQAFLLTSATAIAATSYTLKEIDYSMLPGDVVQVRMGFDRPVQSKPASFSVDSPARVSVDFVATSLALKEKNQIVDMGVLNRMRAVQSTDRARLVFTLKRNAPYEILTEADNVYIRFGRKSTQVTADTVENVLLRSNTLEGIDFRRGEQGAGQISVTLPEPSTVVNMSEKDGKLVVDFINATLPQKLVRRLDVRDFATPVSTIDAFNVGAGARMVIDAGGAYDHMAYQTGTEFTVNVTPLTEEEIAERKKDRLGYSGEKLSLNFQNIEVRAVLQLLADFTGLNVVASDSVGGNITLRLKNVPWDQALDIILKTRGLGMRKTGNVVLIAPNDELAAREKKELEAEKQKVELAPLRTRYHQINYAKAADIAKLLKGKENSILTDRGSVTVDERTNTLMVLESAGKQDEIAALVEKLDVPIKQVMIESRIVVANDDFGRDIGIRTGFTGARDDQDTVGVVTGGAAGADQMIQEANDNINNTGVPFPIALPTQTDRYNVNLPTSGGRLALAILRSDFLVDLELSALQTEGRGEVLSNPRVITSNQKPASIEQGVEIPYQEASSSGATSTSFKKAVLSLQVTPQITPDDRVVMDLSVNKDSVGGIYAGVPSINTRSIVTQVLVNNGDTVVLGGVYEQSVSEGETKVPLLGDIPLLGMLFRTKSKKESKAELLIFVTPKILSDKIKTGL